mmetsp:Transcript_46316/g.123001  ORF Transcript_46316/g.123001 Transcript_46316/m.123001 type:complete len:86 (-) Transcript_46316:89-346(-)
MCWGVTPHLAMRKFDAAALSDEIGVTINRWTCAPGLVPFCPGVTCVEQRLHARCASEPPAFERPPLVWTGWPPAPCQLRGLEPSR